MPWIKFTSDYDFKVNPRVLLAYKARQRYLVSQACASEAIDAGKAVASPANAEGTGEQQDTADASR